MHLDKLLLEVPEVFESERLIIRMPLPGDGKAICEATMETLDSLRQWMPWALKEPTVEDSEIVARQARAKYLAREDFMLLLFLKDTNTFVGGSGLHVRKPDDWDVPKFEIGYWVRKSMEGKGYITEAVERITRFGFEDMHAHRIEIRCDELNLRSRKVAERAGYVLQGRFENDALNTSGALRTTLIFGKTQ